MALRVLSAAVPAIGAFAIEPPSPLAPWHILHLAA